GQFNVSHPEQSILTVAPPMAFGFLDSPTEIQVQGSELTVASKSDLSIVGGNLTLNHAKLLAISGKINLVSVASKGEVAAKINYLGDKRPDTSDFTQFGQITMTDSHIETSGSPAGWLNIHGGQFFMNDSLIHSHNFGDEAGKDIDIQLSDSMNMYGDIAKISNHQHTENNIEESFGIISDTFGTGKAGQISITVPYLEMHHNTIDVSTRGAGEGGNIEIQTQQIHMGENAKILNNSYSTGNGGQINIKATERLELIDQHIFLTEEDVDKYWKTNIKTNNLSSGNGGSINIDTQYLKLSSGYIFSNTNGQGHGGTIMINSNFLELVSGSLIMAGVLPDGTGNGGEIELNITDTIKLSGFRPGFISDNSIMIHNLQSGIGPVTTGAGNGGLLDISAKNLIISDYASVGAATLTSGNAGSMKIDVDNLYLQSGGLLTNSSSAILGGKFWLATGNGGNITVIAKEDIIIEGHNPFNPSGIVTNTFFGNSGNMDIQANRLILRDGGTISANSLGTGNAGDIQIKANQISLEQGGEITSAAVQAIGGNIIVNTSYLFNLQDSQITTSVHGGIGDGGNINISNPQFSILNQGQIIAQADAGHGGNINIKSEHFITSPNSLVSASSRLGLDGKVNIDSPDMDMARFLVILSDDYVDVSNQIKKPCSMQGSSFFVHKMNGSPQTPFDYQPAHYIPETDDKITQDSMNPEEKI
ncbi:MAG: hypothetical protein KAG43_09905, partial [Candidatus Marithrix sp.]|nr:hypothetical protein [Candidatus Marithrix sp.]